MINKAHPTTRLATGIKNKCRNLKLIAERMQTNGMATEAIIKSTEVRAASVAFKKLQV